MSLNRKICRQTRPIRSTKITKGQNFESIHLLIPLRTVLEVHMAMCDMVHLPREFLFAGSWDKTWNIIKQMHSTQKKQHDNEKTKISIMYLLLKLMNFPQAMNVSFQAGTCTYEKNACTLLSTVPERTCKLLLCISSSSWRPNMKEPSTQCWRFQQTFAAKGQWFQESNLKFSWV